MTTQDTQSLRMTGGTLSMPSVNLLPPEVAEAAKFRRLQLVMGAAVLGAAVVVGGLYVQAHSSVAAANQQLANAVQQGQTLQQKVASLQNVSAVYEQAQTEQAILTSAMSNEIRWSFVLNDLSMRIPSNVWLTSVTVSTGAAATSAPGAGAAAAAVGGVGTITFNGVAFAHDDVANWLDALSLERGFANVSFSSSTENLIGTKKVVDFVSSATLTPAAESHRAQTMAGN